MKTKTCSKCEKEKPVDQFGKLSKSKDGLKGQCKSCCALASAESYARKNGVKIPYKKDLEPKVKKGYKICNKCNVEKLLKDFYTSEILKCGYASTCKICESKRVRNYFQQVKQQPKTHIKYKTCNICREKKSISQFSKNKTRLDGYCLRCKTCYSLKNTGYRNKNKQRNLIAFNHKNRMHSKKRDYGILEYEIQEKMNQQRGGCAICECDLGTLERQYHIDHNHNTNQVRGLLCSSCNTLLGAAKEQEKILFKAITYLNDYMYNEVI